MKITWFTLHSLQNSNYKLSGRIACSKFDRKIIKCNWRVGVDYFPPYLHSGIGILLSYINWHGILTKLPLSSIFLLIETKKYKSRRKKNANPSQNCKFHCGLWVIFYRKIFNPLILVLTEFMGHFSKIDTYFLKK